MTQQNPTFLMVGLDGVTRLDLNDAIQYAHPDASILLAEVMDDAAPMLAELDALQGAIILAGPSELSQSPLLAELQRLGAAIVLMGGAAERGAQDSPYMVLQSPFGADDILHALALNPSRCQN